MLLDEAKSAEEVADALEAGDEDLREDIENILYRAKTRWESSGRGYDEDYEPIDMGDIVAQDHFVDQVIHDSPARYDLSQIPREAVDSELQATARTRARGRHKYGPFYIDDRGGDHFSYKLSYGGNYTFPGSLFPKNAEFIPSDIAKEFWDSLGDAYEWTYTSRVDRNEDNYATGPGTDAYVEANEEEFNEWCRDLISTYINGAVKRHPEKAKEIFFNGLADEDKDLAEKLKAADLPEEELLSFAVAWFESQEDKEEVLDALRDYFGALESGSGEPREVIAEFSKQDIADMGIKKGALFENAPWKLIKLHPSDLRLEGTLMRHCVGKADMGYIKAVKDGEIEIWSLRSRDNKPRFTLEVDSKFYTADDGSPPMQTLTPAYYRGRAIKQLKGKANRTPGFADNSQSGGIKFPDEVIFWDHALRSLDVAPQEVDDFDAARQEPMKLQANDGERCVGFDVPYRPLRENRRSSKRRGSKRRSSRRRSSRR
jgi:hypothetical protein